MSETVFSRADLLAAEKQQLRLLVEQQHSNPTQQSAFTSHAPPFPIISLSDDTPSGSDDFFSSYLNDDASNRSKSPFPSAASSFPGYSATSDFYSQPQLSPASPSAYSKLASYDQPFTTHKRSHHQLSAADDLPPTKRLTVELPASNHAHYKKGSQQTATLQAQYPLLSSELVDGFFTSNVNVSSGVMGGLDDSELGLAFGSMSRQASEESLVQKVKEQVEEEQPEAVTVAAPLPMLSLEPQSSQQSVASTSSSTAPPMPFMTSSLSSALSSISSSSSSSSPASSPAHDNPSLSNLTNRLLPPDAKGEGQRRMKRRLTDKQRRAKIKDGLEHLRSLVALHGNASSDQASIVNSSVDLVQQLVDERDDLKRELRQATDERAEIEREQQIAIDKQRLAAAVLPSQLPAASASASDKPADLSVLLHHLSNILTPVLGNGAQAGSEASSSSSSTGGAAPAGGLENLVLSQYFLQTLRLLTNLPRNQA